MFSGGLHLLGGWGLGVGGKGLVHVCGWGWGWGYPTNRYDTPVSYVQKIK